MGSRLHRAGPKSRAIFPGRRGAGRPGAPPLEQKNQLLKAADTALYAAKTKGKDCVVAAPPGPAGTASVPVILKS